MTFGGNAASKFIINLENSFEVNKKQKIVCSNKKERKEGTLREAR